MKPSRDFMEMRKGSQTVDDGSDQMSVYATAG